MRWSWAALGVLLLVVGGVWILQGVGALEGSFMTGRSVWAWIGSATALAGVLVLVFARRRDPS